MHNVQPVWASRAWLQARLGTFGTETLAFLCLLGAGYKGSALLEIGTVPWTEGLGTGTNGGRTWYWMYRVEWPAGVGMCPLISSGGKCLVYSRLHYKHPAQGGSRYAHRH